MTTEAPEPLPLAPAAPAPPSEPPYPPPCGPLTARTADPSYFVIPGFGVKTMASPEPEATRNPFLLRAEQDQNKTRKEILEQARIASENAAKQAIAESRDSGASDGSSLARASRLAELESASAKMRLSAVLMSKDGGSAVIDGRVYRTGTKVGVSDLVLAEVRADGVKLACADITVALSFINSAASSIDLKNPGADPPAAASQSPKSNPGSSGSNSGGGTSP